MLVAPYLFERRRHADEEQVRAAIADLADHVTVLPGCEVTVAITGDHRPRDLLADGADQFLDDFFPGPQEEEAQRIAAGRFDQFGHEVDSGHPIAEADPQGPGS